MDKKTMWSLAAKNGLILSSITVVIVSLATFIDLPSIVNTILSITKVIAIIYVLHFFMNEYSEKQDFVSYGDSFKYGFTICFLSSIVCTLFDLLVFFYLIPDALDTSLETYMFMLDKFNMTETMDYDTIKGLFLKALPLSILITYIIYGLIYSSIIANFTKKDDMFPTSQDL